MIDKKLSIWPKAPGLFTGVNWKFSFLGHSCLLFVHYVEDMTFRLVLCDELDMEDSIKIDLEFDDYAFKTWFKWEQDQQFLRL